MGICLLLKLKMSKIRVEKYFNVPIQNSSYFYNYNCNVIQL